MEILSLTALRKRLFEVVDRVLATGTPAVVERNGRRVLLVPEDRIGSRLSRLRRRNGIVGDPETLVEQKVGKWDEARNLRSST
jgi:hypothetical protein